MRWLFPGPVPQVLWNTRHHDPRAEEQGSFQTESRLVMQEIFPPVRDHKFRQDDRQCIVGEKLMHRIDISQQGP